MELFGMNISWRKQREAQGVPVTTDPNHPSNQSVSGGSFSERVVYVNNPLSALSVSPVYRALKLTMDTMGVMPVQYRKKDSAGGNFVEDMRGLGKRINYLLQIAPNPIMTAHDMWNLVTYNQHMRGNGLVYIERDEFGFPYHLWLVRTGEYNLITGYYNFIEYLTEDGYKTEINVSRDDVMHFPNTYLYKRIFHSFSLHFYSELVGGGHELCVLYRAFLVHAGSADLAALLAAFVAGEKTAQRGK